MIYVFFIAINKNCLTNMYNYFVLFLECDAGFWGKNCVEVCGHCLSGTCNARNGVCSEGCDAGFKDTPKCEMKGMQNIVQANQFKKNGSNVHLNR
jgi:hypothetical protein